MSQPHERNDRLVDALCGPFLAALPVTGVTISVTGRAGLRTGVAVSDPVAARWDELELELGSGPLTDAAARSVLQLVDDLERAQLNPLLANALQALSVRSLLALPLTLGSATVGVAGLYRLRKGALSAGELARALELARAVTGPTVRAALRSATTDDDDDSDDRGGLRREVHQATGMLSAALDITVSEAFTRLRARAVASGRSLNALSGDIVNGVLDPSRFDWD